MERKFTCDNVKMTSFDNFKGQSVWSAVEEFHWVPYSLEDVLVPLMPGRLHLSELLHLHIFILYSAIRVKAIDSHLFCLGENLKKRTRNYTYVRVQATIVAQLRVHRTKSLTSNSNGRKGKEEEERAACVFHSIWYFFHHACTGVLFIARAVVRSTRFHLPCFSNV